MIAPAIDAEPDLATAARTCSFCGDITAAADLKRRWGRSVCGWCLHQVPPSKVLTPEMEHAMRPWTPAHLHELMDAAGVMSAVCFADRTCADERQDITTTLFCLNDARPHQRRYLIQRLRFEAGELLRCVPPSQFADRLAAAIDRTED